MSHVKTFSLILTGTEKLIRIGSEGELINFFDQPVAVAVYFNRNSNPTFGFISRLYLAQWTGASGTFMDMRIPAGTTIADIVLSSETPGLDSVWVRVNLFGYG